MKVLITGATGYIGGRLVPDVLERGHRVRVLVRDQRRIIGRPWADDVEVASGDLTEPDSLKSALENIDAAYYLVHSMYSGSDYAERDRYAARNFIQAARKLKKVVYLGGLLPDAKKVSQHLKSRGEVGEILRDSLPTTEFRAGPIIGSGSASFEMVRYLTERLPVMIAPRWVLNEVQPIAIRDILKDLVLALEHEALGIVEVGADRLTFKQMMEVYADARGLKRIIFPVPVLAPKLAALWVGLVTPISNSLAVPLVEGVIHPVLADTTKATKIFPEVKPLSYRQAVEFALRRTHEGEVETRWSGALGDTPAYKLSDREGLIREVRTLDVSAPPEAVFQSFSSLGGERGWLVWEWAWSLRGSFDKIVGGPGLRRGRRHPIELLSGEALDFWRVEEVRTPRLLRLRAEMRLPGRAWLQWEAYPNGAGTRLVQTASFAPKGLGGTLYWYLLYPLHRVIFNDLVRAIADNAEKKR
ncbi:MAG TPA: DUF2867 domain-containing protein [Thermodesulfobacteriota bacterium]|nr:DUF2867 domain-containing protein [Thermodesulfobacteriota bacterium]